MSSCKTLVVSHPPVYYLVCLYEENFEIKLFISIWASKHRSNVFCLILLQEKHQKLYRLMKWIQNENSNLFSRQILLFNFKIWQIGKKIHTTFEFRITDSHYKQFFLQNNFLQFNVFLCVWFKSRKGCISIKRSQRTLISYSFHRPIKFLGVFLEVE